MSHLFDLVSPGFHFFEGPRLLRAAIALLSTVHKNQRARDLMRESIHDTRNKAVVPRKDVCLA